jgi:hypothetical protein
MSTSYTRFKKPITCVRIETVGPHDRVTVWINHQNTGTLVVDAGTGSDILEMFDSGEQVLHCYAGPLTGPDLDGTSKGACVVRTDPNISDDEYVISEYGVVMTAGEVQKGRRLVNRTFDIKFK